MFRPGFIRPLDGIRAKTRWYRVLYRLLSPVATIFARIAPNTVTSTQEVGRAMLSAARHGYEKRVVEMADIRRLAKAV